jgi:hypothetical protein
VRIIYFHKHVHLFVFISYLAAQCTDMDRPKLGKEYFGIHYVNIFILF